MHYQPILRVLSSVHWGIRGAGCFKRFACVFTIDSGVDLSKLRSYEHLDRSRSRPNSTDTHNLVSLCRDYKQIGPWKGNRSRKREGCVSKERPKGMRKIVFESENEDVVKMEIRFTRVSRRGI